MKRRRCTETRRVPTSTFLDLTTYMLSSNDLQNFIEETWYDRELKTHQSRYRERTQLVLGVVAAACNESRPIISGFPKAKNEAIKSVLYTITLETNSTRSGANHKENSYNRSFAYSHCNYHIISIKVDLLLRRKS